MRGVVTLAAALLLPAETRHRDVLVLIAVVVTIGTLLIQGTTLPGLARRLGVRGPDPREDALQAATVLQAATRSGLDVLDSMTELDGATREMLRSRSEDRLNQMWERLGPRSGDADETPSAVYRRARMQMLQAERDEVLRLRDEGRADHVVLRTVLASLDLEETMLDRLDDQESRLAESEMLPVDTIEAACEHLRATDSCAAAADTRRGARSACATARPGCTCASASSAGTSAAATRRRASTRRPTSTRRSTR